jgi:vacuolar-type H+-ATPase subunit F/Vma7
MTGRCCYIGEEVTAAGLRLAGVDVYQPPPEETAALFQRLRGEAGMILLDATTAEALPPQLLAEALREQRPLVQVIPDLRGRHAPVDVAAALKRQLGLAEEHE